MRATILIFLSFLILNPLFAQTTTVNYSASAADILNPERGFYRPTITFSSNHAPLDSATIANWRIPYTPWQATYSVATTLVHRYYVLDDFVTSPISASYLAAIQADFDEARKGGAKLIIRFSYTNTAPTGTCGNWICPPYGDATKAQVLQHIAQLKPYFQTNKDIILAVQMGFIGVWGENYYTDYFGDASVSPFILTTTNWEDRNEVLDSLLNAVPLDRSVQVRYPQLKQRLVYGTGAPTLSPSMVLSEAYQETQKARIGFHNDCFLASADDFGTYADYGPPVSQSDTINLKPYQEADTQFVPMGGETCSAYNPVDDCASAGGRADTEMRRFHFSYLNSDYNNAAVNNDWDGVCLDDIKRNLGYRLLLVNGTFPNTASPEESISINLTLKNDGYAAPFNRRGAEIVLRNAASGDLFFAPLDNDPRYWFSGTHSITQTLCLPPNIPIGSYDLLLNLPDPEPSLFDNPLYAIQLANSSMWESSTGYNDLGHTLTINSNAAGTACSGDLVFTSISVYDPAYCPDILNINGTVSTDLYLAGDRIISDGTINTNNHVLYQATNEIELELDFEVKLGAQFLGYIKACYEID